MPAPGQYFRAEWPIFSTASNFRISIELTWLYLEHTPKKLSEELLGPTLSHPLGHIKPWTKHWPKTEFRGIKDQRDQDFGSYWWHGCSLHSQEFISCFSSTVIEPYTDTDMECSSFEGAAKSGYHEGSISELKLIHSSLIWVMMLLVAEGNGLRPFAFWIFSHQGAEISYSNPKGCNYNEDITEGISDSRHAIVG